MKQPNWDQRLQFLSSYQRKKCQFQKGFELRRENNSGGISWRKGRVFISQVLRFEVLAFEQATEDIYRVYFSDVEIGEFDAEALRFRPVQVMR